MIKLDNGFQGLVNALIDTIGKEQVVKHVKKFFGDEADVNLLNEITLGESKGWADTNQQLDFIASVLQNLDLRKARFDWVVCPIK